MLTSPVSVYQRTRQLWRDSWLAITIARRNVVRQRRRSAMAIAAVAFGIVALIQAGGYIQWVFHSMRESTIRSQLGHVQLVRPGYYQSGKADPFRFLLPAEGASFDAIANDAGVLAISPRLSFSGLVSHGESTLSFIGEATDPERDDQLSRSLIIVDGRTLQKDDRDGVVFGAGLARNLGVKVNDRVVLVATQASGGVNGVELTVRGIFETVSKAYDDSALRIPIQTARSLLRVRGAHAWVVLLDDTERTGAYVANLRSRLPSREFEIVPWYDLADFYNKTVSLFSKQVDVVKIIIAIIIVLSITNSMMMNVMERTGEIGTSMALGADRRRVLGTFLVEGALLGVFGGLLGLAIGLPLASAISTVGIPMPAPPGMARGFIGEVLVTPRLAFEGLTLAFVAATLGSIYPAWRASRLAIVDALRHNR